MSKWKTVRLGDVCEIAAGQGAPQGDSNYCDEGTPFVKAGNLIELIEGKSEKQIQKVSEEVAKSHKLKKYKASSILFAKSGMSCMKGYVYQLKNDCYVVSHLAIVKPKEDFSDYIEYCLRHIKPNTLVKDEAYPSISLQDISNLQIPLPPLETQKQIAAVLDKCTSLISKYKKILEKYDTLIKSRFIEMFGDPTTNPMNWDTVNISSLLTANASNGFFAKRDEYTEDGNVEVLGVVNIVNTMYSRIDLLPKTNASEKDIKKYSVKYGDMLFCRSSLVAEGIGKASIVPENINKTILFECHVIRLRLDLNKCVPEYMQMLSTTSFFRNQVLKHAKTSTMTTIGQDGILKTDVRLPPIEKQKQFLSFIKQIDKSKFEYIYTGVAA